MRCQQKYLQREVHTFISADNDRATVMPNKQECEGKMGTSWVDDNTYITLKCDSMKKYKNSSKFSENGNRITNSHPNYITHYILQWRTFRSFAVFPKYTRKIHACVLCLVVHYLPSSRISGVNFGSMVGKTNYHIVNSVDVVKKITESELSPAEKLTSFVVIASCTSIAVKRSTSSEQN